MVTELQNFKILPSLLHGYHTSQLQNIAIPAIAFSPHIFKNLPTLHMVFFFGLVIPLLGFHQVCLLFYKKSCDIKEFMAWKLLAAVFSVSDETKFDVDNTVNNLIDVNNFKLFISFRKCKERIIQILLISGILNHAGKTPCDKILKISFF